MLSTVNKKTVVFLSSKRPGFEPVSIMIALGVIIALAATAMVVGGSLLDSGRYNKAKTDVSAISTAISHYKFEMEKYPSSLSVLQTKDGQYGPWLDKDTLTDPWGNAYQFSVDEKNGVFGVWSYGKNKKDDTGSYKDSFGGDDIGVSGH